MRRLRVPDLGSARRAAVTRIAAELADNAAALEGTGSAELLRLTAWREDHRAVTRWLSEYPELLAQVEDTYFALERTAQGGPQPAPGRLYSAAAMLRSTLA